MTTFQRRQRTPLALNALRQTLIANDYICATYVLCTRRLWVCGMDVLVENVNWTRDLKLLVKRENHRFFCVREKPFISQPCEFFIQFFVGLEF